MNSNFLNLSYLEEKRSYSRTLSNLTVGGQIRPWRRSPCSWPLKLSLIHLGWRLSKETNDHSLPTASLFCGVEGLKPHCLRFLSQWFLVIFLPLEIGIGTSPEASRNLAELADCALTVFSKPRQSPFGGWQCGAGRFLHRTDASQALPLPVWFIRCEVDAGCQEFLLQQPLVILTTREAWETLVYRRSFIMSILHSYLWQYFPLLASWQVSLGRCLMSHGCTSSVYCGRILVYREGCITFFLENLV